MEYTEYITDLARIYNNLITEGEYYKSLYVYFTLMLTFMDKDATEINTIISNFFSDIIKDNETEVMIIFLIISKSKQIRDELTPEFFEGSPMFELYSSIFKRINNSTKKRVMDTYPIIILFNNLINNQIIQKKKYYVPKREKYIKNNEYDGYINILKNKD